MGSRVYAGEGNLISQEKAKNIVYLKKFIILLSMLVANPCDFWNLSGYI
jgi:hypothetical protein